MERGLTGGGGAQPAARAVAQHGSRASTAGAACAPPRPIEVKKLMAKRMLRGESLGKMPSNQSWQVGSASRLFRLTKPSVSASSCTEAGRTRGKRKMQSLMRGQSRQCGSPGGRQPAQTPPAPPTRIALQGAAAHLEQDLDEDTRGGGGVLFSQAHHLQGTRRTGAGGAAQGASPGRCRAAGGRAYVGTPCCAHAVQPRPQPTRRQPAPAPLLPCCCCAHGPSPTHHPTCSTAQGMASVDSRCANSLAVLRSLLVSSL